MRTASYIASFVAGSDFSFLHLMLIGVVILIYLILGLFMEPFGTVLITLPGLLPVFRAEGIDIIWFGVPWIKLLEIGMIAPPVGMNCFVIRGVAGKYVTTGQIFRGVTPFIAADLVVVPVPGHRDVPARITLSWANLSAAMLDALAQTPG